MSYNSVITLSSFANSCQDLAKSLGYTPTNPVRKALLGPSDGASLTGSKKRMFVFSSQKPIMPKGIEPIIWFNPENRVFSKSGNWYNESIWDTVVTFIDLFVENIQYGSGSSSNSDFMNGLSTLPVMVFDPENPSQTDGKTYLAMVISAGSSPAFYNRPVQTVEDLKLVDVDNIPDKQLRLVEDLHTVFSYDKQSEDEPDDEFVVQPNAGPGRWLATHPEIIDGGEI